MKIFPQAPESWSAHYRKFSIGEWHGMISTKHSEMDFGKALGSLDDLFHEGNIVKWYKKQRNHLAEVHWPGNAEGMPKTVVLKRYGSNTIYHTIRHKIGLPRAIRHWNNAWMLLEKKITTPVPIMIGLKRNGSGQGMIAVETVKHHQRIRDIFPRDYYGEESERAIGQTKINTREFSKICGQYVRSIHDKGIVHRDLSGANILVPDSWDGSVEKLTEEFVILDINRIRWLSQEAMDINYRIQDLERLSIPDNHLKEYYVAYAGDDNDLLKQWPKFLKYRRGYRKIKETKSPFLRGAKKVFFYWPRAR